MDPLPPPKRGRGRPRRSPVDLPPPFADVPLPPLDIEMVPAESHVPEDEPDGDEMVLSEMEREELREVLSEIARRDREALALFEPMPAQEDFFASTAGERLVRGGNRGGKTVVGAVECARAVTGQDPYGKYPKQDGRFLAVGKDLNHCGKVMWRKLSRSGAFKIIRDPHTNRWRSLRPGQEWDEANRHMAKDCPPLIPKRFIKEIAWENKKDEIPKTVKLTTGWEISFFSSIGKPPQGWDVDAAWFDEEIDHPDWYPETSARLLDRGGRFYWTATPQAGTQYLFDIHTKAQEQINDPRATVQEFYLNLLSNPHISEVAKKEFAAKLNEDEYRIRVLGDFALLGTRVYGEFSPRGPHGMESFPIPDSWTRYIAIDPGRQVCAILFAAVPPPGDDHAGRVFLYDELYVKKCNAATFALRLRERIGHEQSVYAAIIDHRAGRITEMGSGITHEEQYSRALKEEGVRFEKTGHKFTWSCDDVRAGLEAVRLGLHLDCEGRSKFVVFRDKCPMLLWEAERYSYKKLPGSGVVTDEPLKIHDHLMDCWRYIAMGNLRHVRAKPRKHKPGYTAEILKQKKARAKAKGGISDSISLF